MPGTFTNNFAKSLYSSPSSSQPQQTTQPSQLSTKAPATPVSQYPSPLPKTPISIDQTPTGKWSHPAVLKITQLQARKAPNDRTLRNVLSNVAALFCVYKIAPYIQDRPYWTLNHVKNYVDWSFYALYALLIYNIVDHAQKFWWTNTFDDPTLTDTQRKLLNLPESPLTSTKRAPNAAITPPRYQKAFTPSPISQSPLAGESRRRSSSNAQSPTANSWSLQRHSALGAHGHSPLQGASPSTMRSVSLLHDSPSSLKASSFSSGTSPSAAPDFSGSARWSFSKGVSQDPLASSRSFY